MKININDSSPLIKYKLLSNIITPRPIAWISSIDENGIVNLAPFSFFAPISCSDPIVFSICITSKSDGEIKDTLKNILKIKKASLCLCPPSHAKALNDTGSELEYGISEANRFNIDLDIINSTYPPIIKGIKAAFMCDFYDLLEIGSYSKTLLLEAKECYIDDSIYSQDLHFVLENIARSGKFYQLPSKLIEAKELK